jgi:hypothetical protein
MTQHAQNPLPVKLQVNSTGAWRNVLDFDCCDSAHVLPAAEHLFTGSKCTLRVIIPGDTAPLMHWTPEGGWKEWAKRSQ